MIALQELGSFVEKAVSEYQFPVQPKNLYDPLRYFMQLGGKRIRPVLTLMGGNLFGVPKEESIAAALSIEFFHNFSLIHDDIMDLAPVRRGQPTVHIKWSNDIAILSGDVLFTEAYQQLSFYRDERLPDLLSCFNRMAREVCEGQQMDMDFEALNDVSEDAYIEMIRLKTSVLLGCALEFGAILARQDAATGERLRNFGVLLGIAFQIQDDWLDLYADPDKFGKQVGGDILANKKTLLLLSARHLAAQKGDQRVETLLKMEAGTAKVETARELFRELGADAAILQKMDAYYQQALAQLEEITVPDAQKAPLRELAAFLMNRES